MLLNEIKCLVTKEIIIEWRQKYAINGVLLYVLSTIFVCYLAFKNVDAITWNTLFWIIMLFASVNAVAKSFIQKSKGEWLYYYTITDPRSIIISKMVYNTLVMLLISAICIVFYSVIMGNPVKSMTLFLVSLFLGSIGFSTSFTMVSAIASKASNSTTLMAILSFPVIVPMLIMLIRLSNNALSGIEGSKNYDEIVALLSITSIVIAVSYILFPYVWKD